MKNKKPTENRSSLYMWLGDGQKKELVSLLKRVGVAMLFIGFMALITTAQWRSSLIHFSSNILVLAILLKCSYIFLPPTRRAKLIEFKNKVVTNYGALSTEQKLYSNICIVVIASQVFLLLGGNQFALGWIMIVGAFCAYVALRDVLRWYKLLSENLLGKAVIGLAFAASTNFAYSLAGQVVAQTINVTPTNFTHTILFITILMIPILMVFAGSVVFIVGIVMSSLVMLPSMLRNTDPRLTRWLFAETLPESNIKFKLATRLFQVFFYSIAGSFIYQSGQNNMAWYESKITHLTPKLVYHFDMYPGTECKLPSGGKLAPLGDAKFLLAHETPSGDIAFTPPVKCDDLPPPSPSNN